METKNHLEIDIKLDLLILGIVEVEVQEQDLIVPRGVKQVLNHGLLLLQHTSYWHKITLQRLMVVITQQ